MPDPSHRSPTQTREAHLRASVAADVPAAAIVETALDAVVTMSEDGFVTGWNARAEAMLGWSRAEAMGRRLSTMVIPPRYRDAHEAGLQRLRRAAEGGRETSRLLEVDALRRDGTTLPVEVAISPPWRSERGVTFIGFIRDVSARRRAERLRAMEAAVTRVLSEAPSLAAAAPAVLEGVGSAMGWAAGNLWLIDGGRLRLAAAWPSTPGAFATESLATSFGPGEGLPGRVWQSGRPMSIADLALADLPRASAAEQSGLHGALAFPVLAGGEPEAVVEFLMSQPADLDDGLLAAMADVGRRIGQFIEHRRAEATVHIRVRELASLLEAARRLQATMDRRVVLTETARAAAESVFADRPDGTRRATVFEVTDEGRVSAVATHDETGDHSHPVAFHLDEHPAMAQAIADDRVVTERFETIGGSVADQAVHLGLVAGAWMPIRSASALHGVLACVSRDDDSFDASQLRLMEGIAHLAGLAVGNAEALHLAREHAERLAGLEAAKTRFLRLASHELRTPLTVLMGYLSMLGEGSLGALASDAREVVTLLTAKVADMDELVTQMLDAARLEDDRLELSLAAADMRTVVAAALRSVEPQRAAAARRILTEIPDGPVPATVDASRAADIVTNLLSNAMKYSPGGGDVVLTLSATGGDVEVAVRDSGVGIAVENLDVLFTRFGRIQTAATRGIPGTGLGLHLARELARMHGGDIAVRSEPGAGSVFTMRLPVTPPA